MCVAVIGGLGYIGRHLVQQLLVMGYKVLIIDKVEDRKLVDSLRKFDRNGKSLTVVKLALPVINNRFKDILITSGVTTVLNVTGSQETCGQTLYLTKYIYHYIAKLCKRVKVYIHTTPMEDKLGYTYDKNLKLDATPENWLMHNITTDHTTSLKVGVLRLPEAYGHHLRLPMFGGNHTWGMLESIRNGNLAKFPVYAENIQTWDGSPLRDYCPVFDIAGGVIDMWGFVKDSKGFTFAACDIGSGVNLTLRQFINIYESHYDIKVFTETQSINKPVPTLRADTLAGESLIGWTRIFGSKILTNAELNEHYNHFEKALSMQQVNQ